MGRSPDDQPLTVKELALEAGVSESTVRNWANKSDRPLERVPGTGRAVLHTWAQLRAFCVAHPGLHAVRRINRRQLTSGGATDVQAAAADPEQVRAVIRNLRAIAGSNLQAALSAARAAERLAAAHREQLEALTASINGYDDLLTQLSTPTTPND